MTTHRRSRRSRPVTAHKPVVAGTTASRLAEIILKALQSVGESLEIDGPIAASIGIALCPDDAADRHALLSHADTALYRAKNEGRGTYRYFDVSMGAAIRECRLLEHDLRDAISHGRDEARLPATERRPHRRSRGP